MAGPNTKRQLSLWRQVCSSLSFLFSPAATKTILREPMCREVSLSKNFSSPFRACWAIPLASAFLRILPSAAYPLQAFCCPLLHLWRPQLSFTHKKNYTKPGCWQSSALWYSAPWSSMVGSDNGACFLSPF